MVIKTRKNSIDSPRGEVGEIDTRAPFESVKAAVSLFGDVVSTPEQHGIRKTRRPSSEEVVVKETQLHLALKEQYKIKEQLKNAHSTKTQAQAELEVAKKTVEELIQELQAVTESKESAITATEAAKNEAKQLENGNSADTVIDDSSWKHELESAREQYTAVITELDVAKQELRKISEDFESSLSAKVAAFQQVEGAELAKEANREKANELSQEIALVQDSLAQVKLACLQEQEERTKILEEKDAYVKSSKLALEEMHKKLESLQKEADPEVARNLEEKLAETISSIRLLETLRTLTTELDGAKGTLGEIVEVEEKALRDLVDSLELEIESARKVQSELKEKEDEAESLARNLNAQLQKIKADVEAAIAGESEARAASDEISATIGQLSSDTENAREEAEKMKKATEELNRDAEAARAALAEAEKQLEAALVDAEAARAAEQAALDQIKSLSNKTNASSASAAEVGAGITISRDEHKALRRKIEDSDSLAEIKVQAALAQVEAVRASENAALRRFEAVETEIEEMKSATAEALNRAELAEAAKRAIEVEQWKWHEKNPNKAGEAAAPTVVAETEVFVQAPPMQTNKATPPKANNGSLEKTSGQKKALLLNLSSYFQRKKSHVVDGGESPLPGEKQV